MADNPPVSRETLPATPAEWQAAPVEARDTEAFILRCRGYTFPEIAASLGYNSPQAAHLSYKRGLKRRVDEADPEERQIDAERLDNLIRGLSKQLDKLCRENPVYLMSESAQGAMDRIIKLIARKAALLGMDAPTKIAPTDPSGEREYQGMTDDEARSRLAALFDTARARRDGEAAAAGDAASAVAPEPEKPPTE